MEAKHLVSSEILRINEEITNLIIWKRNYWTRENYSKVTKKRRKWSKWLLAAVVKYS